MMLYLFAFSQMPIHYHILQHSTYSTSKNNLLSVQHSALLSELYQHVAEMHCAAI
jgi:hypothetical protein